MTGQATASNLDTHSDLGRSKVRMLLSFQRPPHLLEGFSLPGGSGACFGPDWRV